jgi:pimeloyl-ACP methyl ester carboxylesterase
MEKKILHVASNGITFYCEQRGTGPAIVLIPDGSNDCEPFDRLAACLADEFTVLSFDPRGGSRSPDPAPQSLTPGILAEDVAGIVRGLNLGKVGVYGCSSGAQAALAFGKYFPTMVRNIAVHEVALKETPLANAGLEFFRNLRTFAPHLTNGLGPIDFLTLNADAVLRVSPECRQRMKANAVFWSKYYLGKADSESYFEADFAAMPPVDFTVGAWSAAWIVYGNLDVAARGARSVTWINAAHHPELTCPDEFAEHLRGVFRRYL